MKQKMFKSINPCPNCENKNWYCYYCSDEDKNLKIPDESTAIVDINNLLYVFNNIIHYKDYLIYIDECKNCGCILSFYI